MRSPTNGKAGKKGTGCEVAFSSAPDMHSQSLISRAKEKACKEVLGIALQELHLGHVQAQSHLCDCT